MNTQDIAVNRAVTLLKAANAVFEIHHAGKIYGELPKQKLPTAKKKNRIPTEHRGKLTNHIRAQLKGKEIGSVLTFHLSDPELSHVNIEQLQASVASIASATWGVQTYVSHRTNKNTAVELLRVA
jgi:hypothetical protein